LCKVTSILAYYSVYKFLPKELALCNKGGLHVP
jgi:hypothetical protein